MTMNESNVALTNAVLAGNHLAAKAAICAGENPNGIWGDQPLITHAASQHQVEMFRLLTDHGAVIPNSILNDIICWELGDWIIQNDSDIDAFIAILKLIRESGVWPSREERQTLAVRIDGYGLDRIISVLLE